MTNNQDKWDDNRSERPADATGPIRSAPPSQFRPPASLLRRAAPAAVLGGVAVALVGFLDPALGGKGTAGEAQSAPAAAPSATSTPTPTTSSGDATAASPDTQSTQSSEPSDSATADAESCSGTTQTVTGTAVAIPWGDVQVAATIAGGTVCSVHAVAYPDGDPHSARINSTAIPTLDAAATTAGVEFDNISGATYTSEAYRKSLQSILDQL